MQTEKQKALRSEGNVKEGVILPFAPSKRTEPQALTGLRFLYCYDRMKAINSNLTEEL